MWSQGAERAIQDIDQRVRAIVGTATQMYQAQELSPYLDTLERASQDTVKLMADLRQALQCQPIFRYTLYTCQMQRLEYETKTHSPHILRTHKSTIINDNEMNLDHAS